MKGVKEKRKRDKEIERSDRIEGAFAKMNRQDEYLQQLLTDRFEMQLMLTLYL